MYYGIDLGTTNSIIGSGENVYTGLVSSSVDINFKRQVARDEIGENIISSYKVNMTIGSGGEVPIACSAIILKDLANKASKRAGEEIKDVVISVPAKFSSTQREAVIKSAEIAGLNPQGLINEPTAAALYVCRQLKDLVIVYDLGGGTFDVTIIDARLGNYSVIATDGKILAGDNFDEALAGLAYEECDIKIRYRGKKHKKQIMRDIRKAKESIQRTGISEYVDMSSYGSKKDFELTIDKYIATMKKVFHPTLTLTTRIVNTYLPETEKPKLVFVGGSTACRYLKEWIKESTGLESIDCDESPDLIVAKGVALYAEMLYNGTAQKEVEDVTKRMCIEDETGKSITVIDKNTIIPVTQSIQVYNPVDSSELEVNLYQGDSLLCSGCTYIGTLTYLYGEFKKAGEGFIEVQVSVNRDGRVSLKGIDILTGDEQEVKLKMR